MGALLTLPLARVLGDVAEREAVATGVPVTVAVVDGEAGLIYLARQDGSLPASRELAIGKAKTAASLRMTSAEVGRLAQPGGMLYGVQNAQPGEVVTFGGGFPLRLGGVVIGGIGVSGGTVDEDERIAEPAVAALAQMERYAEPVARSVAAGSVSGEQFARVVPALQATLAGLEPPLPARAQLILSGAVLLGLAAGRDTPVGI